MRTRFIGKKKVRPEDVRDAHERVANLMPVTYMKLPLKLICMFVCTISKLIFFEKKSK
jgi:hypothetical protein